MRKVGGATGVVGRQPVPMPVNGGREVTATTTGSKAGVPAAAGTETAGHARPGRSSDPSGPDRGATRDRRVPGAGGVAVRHEGAHVRPVLRGDQPAAHRGNPNPTAAVSTIGGTPVVAQSFRGSGHAPGGPPAPAGQGRAGRAADISALAREARGRALRATGPARYTALTPSEKSIPLRTNAPVSPTRRAVLQTIATILALAALAVLAGCGTSTTPTPGATAGGVAPSTQVMIIRHGEKPDDTNPGVDANQDNTSLTEIGWNRAYRLVDLVDPAQGPPRPGLSRPTAIYAAGANDGKGARTRETVAALADKLGIPVNTSFGRSDEKALVRHVISGQGPTLISWQHDGIPTIAAAFPSVTPTPPSEWPDGRFDVVWTFTKTADGWHFAQMPELALPQDQAGVIED
jgi:broad specificity phosphatase PhoE